MNSNNDATESKETVSKRHVVAAADHCKRDDFVSAHAALLKAIEAWPENATAHRNMGVVLCHSGRIHDGIHFLEKSLTLEPDHIGALEFLKEVRQGRVPPMPLQAASPTPSPKSGGEGWYQFVKTIAVVWIIYGIIGGVVILAAKDEFSDGIVTFLLISDLAQIVVAIGIIARMQWARYAGFLCCVVALINFPVWTVLGLLMLLGLLMSAGMFAKERREIERSELTDLEARLAALRQPTQPAPQNEKQEDVH